MIAGAPSKRQALAHLLERTGSLDAILKLRERADTPWLTILTYHRFPSAEDDRLFDDGVADVTLEAFEYQIACIKKYFNVVGAEELCAMGARGAARALPRNPVAITFDDGYLCNYKVALPILKKHDCKALFFVATSFISERRIYWWDRIAYAIKTSLRESLHLEYPARMAFPLRGPRGPAIRRVLRLVKDHPALDVPRFLAELGRAANVPWSSALDRRFADRLLMTWDHVRALRNAGMDVQSHTRTHRVLQTLSSADLRDELEGSRDDLRRELGAPSRAIAYPVGNPVDFASPVRAAIARAGYEIGLTNGTGPTPLRRRVDPFDIRRQTVDQEMSNALFRTILAIPPLAPTHSWPCQNVSP